MDCPSLYQCIFGRSTLAELIVVPFTVHLKMKYYTSKGLVATLHGDIEAARRCFEAASKGLNTIGTRPKTPSKPTLPCSSHEPMLLPRVDSIDLDNRFTKDDLKRKGKGA